MKTIFAIVLFTILFINLGNQSFAQSESLEEYARSYQYTVKDELDRLWLGYYHGESWSPQRHQYPEYQSPSASSYIFESLEKSRFWQDKLEEIREDYWDITPYNTSPGLRVTEYGILLEDLGIVAKTIEDMDILIITANKVETEWREQEHESEIEKLEKEKEEALNLKRVTEVQGQAYKKLNNLKSDLDSAKTLIKTNTPTSSEAREKNDHAWDLLKENDKILNSFETRIKVADEMLAKNNVDLEKNFLFGNTPGSYKFDENLKEIENLVEEIEKLESRFCFLFWCW